MSDPATMSLAFGGDEFAILMGRPSEPEEIVALANRLIRSINEAFLIDGNEVYVGASIGIETYSEDACDAETLLRHADIALYRAKAEGRGTYRFFSKAMNDEVRSRVTLTDELRSAISTGQLFLVYQPQVLANDGHIIGVEALVRWRHPRQRNSHARVLLAGGGKQRSHGSPWVNGFCERPAGRRVNGLTPGSNPARLR